ncbi:hypothetical protein [Georgenia sp. Z1491]|uniref:hypothetical protein n=1 Tax=Georgenia sp. Z1491 TaxID=3416707 RepID=UPI003CE99E85
MVFAARDALGAVAGVRWLADADLPLLAVSGLLTSAPLAVRELEAVHPNMTIVDTMALDEPEQAVMLRDAALATRTRGVPGLAALSEDAKAV